MKRYQREYHCQVCGGWQRTGETQVPECCGQPMIWLRADQKAVMGIDTRTRLPEARRAMLRDELDREDEA